MSFVDECKILFKAGNGGNGVVAWRREAHVPMGGPAGGNGGNGGNIILVGDHNENSLQHLKYLKKIVAGDGSNGQIKTMNGANGKDVFVKVPLGTMVYENGKLIVDISEDNQKYVICYGGIGGYGNFHFKSNFNKAPSLYEFGDIGEQKECTLILKQIADVGIIGLPNAGKSTFISKISNAKPKTANYKFTTLNPILGTIYRDNNKIVFADIPGLIEGASEGLGLGHNFLRHIERTRVLIHLISMDNFDNEDVYIAYETIMNELNKYSGSLSRKKMIIVANKIDVDGAEQNFKILQDKLMPRKVYKISALNNINLNSIIDMAYKVVMEERKKDETNKKIDFIYKGEVPKNKSDLLDKKLNITKINDNEWNIECEYLEYWSRKIPLNTQDNIVRFNQKMQSLNVEEILKEKGAKKGDTLKIYNIEMELDD